MVKNINEFPEIVRNAAKEYVSTYLRMEGESDFVKGFRDSHLWMMKILEQSQDESRRQLAECIDILLFEHMLVESAEYSYAIENWHDDARYWQS
jgi:hypothetical protein